LSQKYKTVLKLFEIVAVGLFFTFKLIP